MNLLESILNAQNGGLVRQIADSFQLDEDKARSAMGALIPALSKGLSNNTSKQQGLDSLVSALNRGNHSRYFEDPGVATQAVAVEEGNGILGHIFGRKDVSRKVASRAAESSGVDSGILKKMLPMLASIAMGALAKQGFGGGAGSAAASSGGGGIGGLLSRFLDADKDGSAMDDILAMAARFLR